LDVSVILATYNQPDWLEKVIWGYATQRHRAFEIIVADDGSTSETAALIARLKNDTGIRIQHVWHEDQGFRKCKILNKAILSANYDYLVFSDGDCIPREDFLTTHVCHATRGRFLSGGIVRLPLELSKQIKIDDILCQRSTNLAWLRQRGLSLSKKCFKLTQSPRRARILDQLTTTRATWNGHNASGWKQDLLQANGFDERMGYGGEDRELGSRLMNLGIRPYQIRHRAVCVHLDHSRSYIDEEILQWNKQHRKDVRRARLTWTDHGVMAVRDGVQKHILLKFLGESRELPTLETSQASEELQENIILEFPGREKQHRKAA